MSNWYEHIFCKKRYPRASLLFYFAPPGNPERGVKPYLFAGPISKINSTRITCHSIRIIHSFAPKHLSSWVSTVLHVPANVRSACCGEYDLSQICISCVARAILASGIYFLVSPSHLFCFSSHCASHCCPLLCSVWQPLFPPTSVSG